MYDHHIQDMSLAVIKALAAQGIPAPAEPIINALRDYWADYAVHVWSMDDIFDQSLRIGWPMCLADAHEILCDIEDHIDCECGITWDVLTSSIESWGESIRWAELSDEQMAAYKGNFVLAWQTPGGDPKRYQPIINSSLLDAIQQARKIGKRHGVSVKVISVEDWVADDPEGAVEFGYQLLTVI